jgi:hypothetical protein
MKKEKRRGGMRGIKTKIWFIKTVLLQILGGLK